MPDSTNKLTLKQKAFAEYYVQSGNATDAAKKAGYKEKAAQRMGSENLSKPLISAYIAELMADEEERRIADANEVVKFFTSVMRGEVKDQFGLDASLSDRLKAGVELMKRHDAGKTYGSKKREDDPLSKALKEEAERLNNGDLT